MSAPQHTSGQLGRDCEDDPPDSLSFLGLSPLLRLSPHQIQAMDPAIKKIVLDEDARTERLLKRVGELEREVTKDCQNCLNNNSNENRIKELRARISLLERVIKISCKKHFCLKALVKIFKKRIPILEEWATSPKRVPEDGVEESLKKVELWKRLVNKYEGVYNNDYEKEEWLPETSNQQNTSTESPQNTMELLNTLLHAQEGYKSQIDDLKASIYGKDVVIGELCEANTELRRIIRSGCRRSSCNDSGEPTGTLFEGEESVELYGASPPRSTAAKAPTTSTKADTFQDAMKQEAQSLTSKGKEVRKHDGEEHSDPSGIMDSSLWQPYVSKRALVSQTPGGSAAIPTGVKSASPRTQKPTQASLLQFRPTQVFRAPSRSQAQAPLYSAIPGSPSRLAQTGQVRGEYVLGNGEPLDLHIATSSYVQPISTTTPETTATLINPNTASTRVPVQLSSCTRLPIEKARTGEPTRENMTSEERFKVKAWNLSSQKIKAEDAADAKAADLAKEQREARGEPAFGTAQVVFDERWVRTNVINYSFQDGVTEDTIVKEGVTGAEAFEKTRTKESKREKQEDPKRGKKEIQKDNSKKDDGMPNKGGWYTYTSSPK